MKNSPRQSPTRFSTRQIIRMLCPDSPTLGLSDYPILLCFSVSLLYLSNSSQRSFGHSKYILSLLFHCDLISLRWFGRLVGELDVSTMNWTSLRCIGCLDGVLDVSDMIWTLSKGPKESYKYNLAKLVSPIYCVVTRSPKSLEMV